MNGYTGFINLKMEIEEKIVQVLFPYRIWE